MFKSSYFISSKFSSIKENNNLYKFSYLIYLLIMSLVMVALLTTTEISNFMYMDISKKVIEKFPYISLSKNIDFDKSEIYGYNDGIIDSIVLSRKNKDIPIKSFIIKELNNKNIKIIEDNKFFLNKNTIILSNKFENDFKIGDYAVITKIGTDKLDLNNQKILNVVGFFNENYEFSAIYMDEKNNNELKLIELKDKTKIDEFISNYFQNKIDNKYYSSWISNSPSIYNSLKLQSISIYLIMGILFFISSSVIFASVASLGISKRKDIGILRMIGVRRKQVFIIFIIHGLKMYIISTFFSLIISLLIIYNFDFLMKLTSIFFNINIDLILDESINQKININIKNIALIILFNLNFVLLASVIPSYFIAKEETGESIKYG